MHGLNELPGVSVFYKDENGDVSIRIPPTRAAATCCSAPTTSSTSPRKGRNETQIMDWVKRNDEYEDSGKPRSCCA